MKTFDPASTIERVLSRAYQVFLALILSTSLLATSGSVTVWAGEQDKNKEKKDPKYIVKQEKPPRDNPPPSDKPKDGGKEKGKKRD